MFGIGWSEFIFLAILALLILGPDKLPEMARQLGKWTRELRKIAGELQGEFAREFNKDEFSDLRRTGLGVMTDGEQPEARAKVNATENDFGAVVRRSATNDSTGSTKDHSGDASQSN